MWLESNPNPSGMVLGWYRGIHDVCRPSFGAIFIIQSNSLSTDVILGYLIK